MQTHLRAVNKAIRAGGSAFSDQHEPFVELLRALARQVDDADIDGPSTRLAAAYLSALKDLHRILASSSRTQGGSILMTEPEDELAAFSRKKGRAG